jgi:hypothetical protein
MVEEGAERAEGQECWSGAPPQALVRVGGELSGRDGEPCATWSGRAAAPWVSGRRTGRSETGDGGAQGGGNDGRCNVRGSGMPRAVRWVKVGAERGAAAARARGMRAQSGPSAAAAPCVARRTGHQ